jgi:hypothetical protein
VRLPLALLLLPPLLAQPSLPETLSRVAEEADALRQNLPKAVSEETLEQRALLPPSRFRPRAGSAVPVPAPRLLVRQVVSEYTVAPLQGSASKQLVEYRQVVSVDGRLVQSERAARHALSIGVKSLDDRLRKRMLEDFAQHGLVDVAADYGLILLEFTARGQQDLEIVPSGRGLVGPEDATIFVWRQNSAAAGELEFIGRQAERHALAGRLWLRSSDGLPLRVETWAEHAEAQHRVRDEAVVEYTQASHGFLAPASVLHRHIVDGQLITENRYTYAPFKVFGADAEIKFSEVPDSPSLQK